MSSTTATTTTNTMPTGATISLTTSQLMKMLAEAKAEGRAEVLQQRPRHGPRAAPRAVRDAALLRLRLLHRSVEVVDAELRGLAADVDLGPLLVGGQRRGSPKHDEGPPAVRAAEEHDFFRAPRDQCCLACVQQTAGCCPRCVRVRATLVLINELCDK